MVDKRKDPKGGESEDQLRAFLVDVATDPAALGRFVKDPDATMSEAGLSPEDQAVLRSGNPTAINARLAGGPAAGPPASRALIAAGLPLLRTAWSSGESPASDMVASGSLTNRPSAAGSVATSTRNARSWSSDSPPLGSLRLSTTRSS